MNIFINKIRINHFLIGRFECEKKGGKKVGKRKLIALNFFHLFVLQGKEGRRENIKEGSTKFFSSHKWRENRTVNRVFSSYM